MNRFATISNLLQLITGVMAAVLVFTFAVSAERAWERWSAALEARAVSAVSRDLFLALQNIRVERGTVNTALTTAEPANADVQGDIAALRRTSEAALDSALAKLGRLHLGEGVTRVNELRSNRDALSKLRQEADAAMRQPKDDRPATLKKSWVAAVNRLVDSIDSLSDRLSTQIDKADPFITDMTTVKALAWSVRDAAGTDRLMVGAAIAASNGLAPDQQRQLAELAGR
ncbi:MAG TPA: hypothetical protein VJO12_00990, partial [Stellaceae bacterium]|nr:hypothetical protein [Stellaceae bacterium]